MSVRPLLPVVGRDRRVPVVGGGDRRYVNLDNAASTPALESVQTAVVEALGDYASVHRGAGYLSQLSTRAYESARDTVAGFVGARPDDAVIFTRNTTDSLNLLASVAPQGALVLDIEHHANLLPWLSRGARAIPAPSRLADLVPVLEGELQRTGAALVAVTGASNVTGERLPLAAISDVAHRNGARLAVDGAQLVPHRPVDLAREGIDYLAFSGHKLYAPFGGGALVGRSDWLDAGRPYLLGGGAVADVTVDATEWHSGPARHEAGSPNVLGAIAIAAAIRELETLDPAQRVTHERELYDELVTGLGAIPGLRQHRIFEDSVDPVGLVSFRLDGISARRTAMFLSAEHGIGVRDGRFCAHPLLARFGGPSVRVSFGVGSSSRDVDRLLEALADLRDRAERPRYTLAGAGWVVESARADSPIS